MEEYKTLLSICSDAEQRRGIEKKMVTFLENDLPELEVCNTSSDEEESYMKKKTEKTKEPSSSMATNRVHEATEKYNSDLDSADEKKAHEELSQGPQTPYTSDSGSDIEDRKTIMTTMWKTSRMITTMKTQRMKTMLKTNAVNSQVQISCQKKICRDIK